MDLTRILREQWDRCLGWSAIAVGVIFLILGWLGVSRNGLTAAQIPYVVSGGLGGIVLVAIGSVLLLSADLQDDWRKLDDLESKLDRLPHLDDQEARIRALESQLQELMVSTIDSPVEPALARPSRRSTASRKKQATSENGSVGK
jgi:hypothetical protein